MRYHLRGFSLLGIKSEASLEENCKGPLELINPSVKLESLVWKP